MNQDIKTIRQGLEELTNMANNAACSAQDRQMVEFMALVAKVMEGLTYKVERLEREVQPNVAFIDDHDVHNRLR